MRDELSLNLRCNDLDESRLQEMTQALAKSIREQNVGAARVGQQASQPGKKGDPVALGSIILTLVSSGGVVVSLVQVLKAYIERKASLNFELSRADGKKVVLNAENLGSAQIRATSEMVDQFLK